MKTLIAAASFVGGVYAGLYLAATAAKQAGCPAAKGGTHAQKAAEERARSTVEDIISTLGACKQRSAPPKTGGESA